MRKKDKNQEYHRFVTFGELNIIHGEISDNMFKPPNIRTQAIQWCLIPDNTKKIKNVLRSYIVRSNLYNANVDDCFSYVLDYFYNPDKVYYQNYTLDGSDYSIDKYVISNLNNAFNIYKSQILKKDGYYSNTESENKINQFGELYTVSNKYSDETLDSLFDSIENRELVVEKYEELVRILNTFLLKNSYNQRFIDKGEYILLYLFIKPLDYDIEENIKKVSSKLKLSEESISIFLEDMKQKYINNNDEILEIYRKIKEILNIVL